MRQITTPNANPCHKRPADSSPLLLRVPRLTQEVLERLRVVLERHSAQPQFTGAFEQIKELPRRGGGRQSVGADIGKTVAVRIGFSRGGRVSEVGAETVGAA